MAVCRARSASRRRRRAPTLAMSWAKTVILPTVAARTPAAGRASRTPTPPSRPLHHYFVPALLCFRRFQRVARSWHCQDWTARHQGRHSSMNWPPRTLSDPSRSISTGRAGLVWPRPKIAIGTERSPAVERRWRHAHDARPYMAPWPAAELGQHTGTSGWACGNNEPTETWYSCESTASLRATPLQDTEHPQ
jgi:hypothetical protein